MVDMVNSPLHYSHGKIECIDAMLSAFGIDETMAFCKLNAFKYLWRTQFKNGAEDMAKAQWYINKWLELDDVQTSNSDKELAEEHENPKLSPKNAQPTDERDWRDYFEELYKYVDKREEEEMHCENCKSCELDEDCYPCTACRNGIPSSDPRHESAPFLWEKA